MLCDPCESTGSITSYRFIVDTNPSDSNLQLKNIVVFFF